MDGVGQQAGLVLAAVALEDGTAAEAAEAVPAAGRTVEALRPAGGAEGVLTLPLRAVGVAEAGMLRPFWMKKSADRPTVQRCSRVVVAQGYARM